MECNDPQLRWCALHVPKHGHTDEEYEDAWAVDAPAGRFAVADGASESAYATRWARLLAEGFVAASGPVDSLAWLDAQRRVWSAAVMELELPWYAEMKREEGAFATLVGLSVRLPTADRPGLWRGVAVGDSCLVRVRKGRYVRAFPLTKSSDFGNNPHLIGSRDGLTPALKHCSGSLLIGDELYLMTDALAQWFLHNQERGGQPWAALAALLSAARPEEAIGPWVEDLRERNEMRDDDVTLLKIAFCPATEE